MLLGSLPFLGLEPLFGFFSELDLCWCSQLSRTAKVILPGAGCFALLAFPRCLNEVELDFLRYDRNGHWRKVPSYGGKV